MRDAAFYYGLNPADFWSSRITDNLAYIKAAQRRKEKESRESWSIMRYQTAIIYRMVQDGKSKPIEPTDIMMFEDEYQEHLKEIEDNKPTPEQIEAREKKINDAFQKYQNKIVQ